MIIMYSIIFKNTVGIPLPGILKKTSFKDKMYFNE